MVNHNNKILKYTNIVLFLILCSCASVPETGFSDAARLIIENALIGNIDNLKSLSENGEVSSNYSLSLIYRFGLQGRQKDSLEADRLYNIACHDVPYTTAIYVPAVGPTPGHTQLMSLHKSTCDYLIDAQVKSCVKSLYIIDVGDGANKHPNYFPCGDAETHFHFAKMWNSKIIEIR